jgi:DNA-binding CsgD family transcriptional regulator
MCNNDFAPSSAFLYATLESLVDGILLVSPAGTVLYQNSMARQICQRICQQLPAHGHPALPQEVWRTCEAAIDSRDMFGDRPVILEAELQSYRIRVQWLDLDRFAPCLLVRLEDCQQSLWGLAIAEAKKYGLTPRETQVWQLRRANLSRQEIADQLLMTMDTVKKHLGNIRVKCQLYQKEWCKG